MKALIFSLFSALILSACGGGGSGGSVDTGPSYTGLTTPVAIDATNAEPIALKTVEATTQAITQEAAQDSNPFAFGASITSTQDNQLNQLVSDIARSIASNAVNLPAAALTYQYNEIPDFGITFCGGSITLSDAYLASFDQFQQQIAPLNGSVTFNSLCVDDMTLGQIIMSGTITITETDTTDTFKYSNFAVTVDGTKHTVNMTVTCSTTVFDCTVSSDYNGEDGKVYRIADVTISGDSNNGYDFAATFYHPDFGSVDIVTLDPVSFACPNGLPSSGTLQYTGADGSSGTISFSGDCINLHDYDGAWDYPSAVDPAPTSGTYTGSWLN